MSAAETVLRIALVCWAQDPLAALTEDQRQWIFARLNRQPSLPLTPSERAKVQAPLLAWAQTTLGPEVVAKLTAQFAAEVAHGHEG